MGIKFLQLSNLEGVIDTEEKKRMFFLDVLEGLSQKPKYLSSKYFYDKEGSKLFQKISELKEYYLTRCESEILEKQKGFLGELFEDEHFNLIDLGSGDAIKTKILIRDFIKRGKKFTYIPIDISHNQLIELINSLETEFGDNLETIALESDYERALHWLIHSSKSKNLALFLGGNIGNYPPKETSKKLRGIQMRLNHNDYLLVGFDLKKDRDILQRAYDDDKGITKKFNMNLLKRINREFGADFNISAFGHHPYFDEEKEAMVSWIVNKSGIEQVINFHNFGTKFIIKPSEAINTEYSYKFEPGERPPDNPNKQGQIGWLAEVNGYNCEKLFTDSEGYFIDALFKIIKPEYK